MSFVPSAAQSDHICGPLSSTLGAMSPMLARGWSAKSSTLCFIPRPAHDAIQPSLCDELMLPYLCGRAIRKYVKRHFLQGEGGGDDTLVDDSNTSLRHAGLSKITSKSNFGVISTQRPVNCEYMWPTSAPFEPIWSTVLVLFPMRRADCRARGERGWPPAVA